MNDINVCCLRFFMAEVPGAEGGGCTLAGRVRGLLAVGRRAPADRAVQCREKNVRESGTDGGRAHDGAAAWPFSGTFETGLPAHIGGIDNGERWQLIAA